MGGVLGDIFNLKKVLTVAYIGMALSFLMLSVGGSQ
jgi:hypothetical protein